MLGPRPATFLQNRANQISLSLEQPQKNLPVRGKEQREERKYRAEPLDSSSSKLLDLARNIQTKVRHYSMSVHPSQFALVKKQSDILRPRLAAPAAVRFHRPRQCIVTCLRSGRIVRSVPFRVGRNHPCPCGSGKKYKKCCGR